MSKHSKGPWVVEGQESSTSYGATVGMDREVWPLLINGPKPPFAMGGLIAAVPFDGYAGEHIANANLIAASPDLLEACKCQLDLEESVSVNCGARYEIISRWLDRMDELCPLDHGRKHEVHHSSTQWAFANLPVLMMKAAIKKAEPN